MNSLNENKFFSNFIKNHTQKKYIIKTSRASSALYCLINEINVKNKYIIVPNTICISVVITAMAVNTNIIYCDTNLHDGNINLNSLKKILKKKIFFL